MATRENRDRLRQIAAGSFCERLAPSVRQAVFRNPNFQKTLGEATENVVKLGNVTFNRKTIFDLFRRFPSQQQQATIEDVGGGHHSIAVAIDQNGDATIGLQDLTFRFEASGLLSFRSKTRVEAASHFLKRHTLLHSAVRAWKAKVRSKPLDDDEYVEFFRYADTSLERVHANVHERIERSGRIDFSALIPETTETFDHLLGSSLQSSGLVKFSKGSLFAQRKALLERDLEKGLGWIGASSIVRDAKILSTISRLDEAKLLSALRNVIRYRDPFTLAFVLDVCAVKLGSGKGFVGLGSQALHELIEVDFAQAQSFRDYVVALPACLVALSKTPSFRSLPLYYRRLAGWSWAGLITRHLGEFEFDRDGFADLVGKQASFRASFSALLERAEAPYWRSEWLWQSNLSGYLRRRVDHTINEIPAGKIPRSWKRILGSAEAPTTTFGPASRITQPGPLDEFLSAPSSPLMPANVVAENELALLTNVPADEIAAIGRFLALVFCSEITDGSLRELKESATRLRKSKLTRIDTSAALVCMHTLSHVAGISRDLDLAKCAVFVARHSTRESKGEDVLLELYTILDAASAITDSRSYCEFVGKCVEDLTMDAVKPDRIEQCLEVIDCLYDAMPVLMPYLGRSRAALKLAQGR